MENVEKQVFAKVWAPTQISFTYWVLKEVQHRNIERVYFLARDGYMSYLIAKRIVEEYNLCIDCRYLECSRYAWRIAEFAMPDINPIDRICIGGVSVSLHTIMQRAGLTINEQREIIRILKENHKLCIEGKESLSYAEIKVLKRCLNECDKLTEYIKAHAKREYINAIEYLRQEGLFDDVTIAMVDSGWTGTMQQTLVHLIESTGHVLKQSLKGFYFGLYELPKGVCKKDYHCYFFEPYININRKVHFSNCLFEAVCSASVGMTIGYKYEGKYVPIRETELNPNSDRIQKNLKWLLHKIDDINFLERCNLPIEEIYNRLRQLMSHPSKEEAECFGTYIFSDDVLSKNSYYLADELSYKETKNLHVFRRILIMKGILKLELKGSSWPEGSIVRCGKNQIWNLFENRVYKYLIYIRKYLYKGL